MTVGIPLGRVGFVPRIDYEPGQECFPLDAVNYQNTLWACLAQTTETPKAGSSNWAPMLSMAASLAAGGGLGLNTNKEIYVKPEAFSGELLEDMMRKMRVPLWLERDTMWYVNGSAGSDQNDGSTPEKAFKTIQAALNYVSSTYHFHLYNATVKIAPGVYNEVVNVPEYTTTSGIMIIEGSDDFKTNPTIINPVFTFSRARHWVLKQVTLSAEGLINDGSRRWLYPIQVLNKGSLYITDVTVDGSNNAATYHSLLVANEGGTLHIGANCSLIGGNCHAAMMVESGGFINLHSNININGAFAYTCLSNSGGSWSVGDPGSNGGQPIRVIGNVSGQRYVVIMNGTINTSGMGPHYFPGTTDGIITTGGQYL